ncbi:hypothetical protein COW95_02650 [Candidatus Peregrinibacteria bacterium CG22_combo_CG10-13_8_21_14_all_49_11]|nr:MAG: hypothetical protein COW95_02650 [Candidatus Peregrinibacteria bacterium CG22_combo_CG10-13_8_21_14_all_49_11]
MIRLRTLPVQVCTCSSSFFLRLHLLLPHSSCDVRPRVSILILNYRSPRDTVRCVHALRQQTIIDDCEVIVIDNHSDDDSIGILRHQLGQIMPVRVVETPRNAGFGFGYNFGARFAQGAYLLINNPAKILPPDGIEQLVQHMEQDTSVGILAPALIHPDGTVRSSARAFPRPLDLVLKRTCLQYFFPRRVRQYELGGQCPSGEVDWVVGGCFLIRSSLFKELEGFDTGNFFLFFEDMDLCRRCWQAGKRVVYTRSVTGSDRKRRLSEGGFLALMCTNIGRAHIRSAWKYFWKWKKMPNPRF